MHDLMDAVAQHLSLDRLMEALFALSSMHRPPATPAFRGAAEYCMEQLVRTGLEPELLSYPADGRMRFWTLTMPEEWHLRCGRLEEILPDGSRRILCDFEQAPLSIAERSAALPPGGIATELVDLDAGGERERLAGKLVLTSGDIRRAREQAVQQGGAAGIVWYSEAAPPGELQYVQWWWVADERRCAGFVVPPEEGRRLRKAAAQGPVRLHAQLDAEFRRGSVDVVTALLPGAEPEEVIIAAHLDHPYPGANDNASGCAVALEIMRLVADAVRRGAMPRPRRGLRVLLTQEILGTIPAAATGLTDRARAGLCLDMVAWRRGEEPGLRIVKSAEASGPYVNRLAERVASSVRQRGGPPISLQPFSSGSDHYVLCDSTVGIPCPLLIRWPDDAWHTSRDVPETLSEDALRAAATFAATYVLAAANAAGGDLGAPSSLPASADAAPQVGARGRTVYARRFRGPIMLRHLQPRMSAAERELFARMVRYPAGETAGRHRGIDELITVLNWTDGRRAVGETLGLAGAELGRDLDTEAVVDFLELLAAHGYLETASANSHTA